MGSESYKIMIGDTLYFSIRQACKCENIPRTTLRFRISEGCNTIKDRKGNIKTFVVMSGKYAE